MTIFALPSPENPSFVTHTNISVITTVPHHEVPALTVLPLPVSVLETRHFQKFTGRRRVINILRWIWINSAPCGPQKIYGQKCDRGEWKQNSHPLCTPFDTMKDLKCFNNFGVPVLNELYFINIS